MSGYVGVTGGLDRRESKCDNVCRGRRPTMRMLRVRLRRDHPGPHPHCGATVARRFPARRARYFGQRLDEDPSTGGQPLRRVRGARRATPNDSVPTTRDHRPVVQAGPGIPGWSVWATHAGTGCDRGVRLVDVPRLLTCPVRQVSRGSSESLPPPRPWRQCCEYLCYLSACVPPATTMLSPATTQASRNSAA